MTKKLGLAMQYPEGYLEARQANGKAGSSGEEDEENKKRGKKRKSVGELVVRSPIAIHYLLHCCVCDG